MHFYTAKDSFNSSVGVDSIVELDQDQARRRSHAIEHIGDNRYKVLSTIHFKEGEVFGIEQKLGTKLQKNLFDAFKSKESEPEPKSVKKPKTIKASRSRK